MYQHPWLSQYFAEVDQERITNQQADFMQGVFGGGQIYCGRTPGTAHVHIHITNEAFDLRQELLKETFEECGVDEEVAAAWPRLDEPFRKKIVQELSDCKKRYYTDKIIHVPSV